MGTGDWNDGMNEVGAGGKGESVWLGWFLHAVLSEWADLADARGEGKRAERWRGHVSALKESLEREAWDGDWYRRAYFDDGTPLGAVGQRRMPHRFDRAVLERDLGRRRPGRAGARHGGRRRAPGASRRRSRRCSSRRRSTSTPLEPGLHQGVSAGRPRERRPVHACGDLVGDRLRGARRRGQGRRALRDVESDQPRQHRSRCPALQGRAVRRRGGRLCRAAARRPRRLDLVHGLGGLDVSGRAWSRFSGSGSAARGS